MDMAGGDKLTFTAVEGGVIDRKEYRHRWLIDRDRV